MASLNGGYQGSIMDENIKSPLHMLMIGKKRVITSILNLLTGSINFISRQVAGVLQIAGALRHLVSSWRKYCDPI